ncbi:MAG: tyrosine-type recombinase/integrase [Nitrososphaerales archaeon]
MAPGVGFEPTRPIRVTDLAGATRGVNGKDLEAYGEFLRVDLQLDPKSVKAYKSIAREFLRHLGDRPISAEVVREYLKGFLDSSTATYANRIKGLRHYLRDWLGLKELAEQFRFPMQSWSPPEAPKREELQAFYQHLPTLEAKAAFLLWASTGKRRHEIIELTRDQIDLENRLIAPSKRDSKTKREWWGVFNEECRKVLSQYLSEARGSRLFSEKRVRVAFEEAREKSGVKITPKRLRDFFCQAMGELGVPDRYVDAFCGRTPKTVLARHYTDYSPDRLKRVYDQVGLKVLSE